PTALYPLSLHDALPIFAPSDVASTESARQHKDATDLIYQAAGTGPPQLIRRLTPLECERLQGFPDGWTALPGASDSARYRALGKDRKSTRLNSSHVSIS